MANRVRTLGTLTGGGDCPGLNAVIRAVATTAMYDYGMQVVGFCDGYYGLVTDRAVRLRRNNVSGILTRGGPILGISNTHDPLGWAAGKVIHIHASGPRPNRLPLYLELGGCLSQ